VPTHPEAAKALAWMGFEARQALLDVLDAAIADHKAKVCVIAYDLNEPEVVSRPPREPGDVAWWKRDYTDAHRIRDRELFA
jgi:hypothetical protein